MKIKWRESKVRLKEDPSPAEKRIMNHLNRKKVKYFREVEFKGLVSDKGYGLYFDFYIPSKNVLIEYDGPHHLVHERIMENDELKNKFCKDNKIKLRRLDRREWMLIEKILNALVSTDYERTDGQKPAPPKKKVKTRKPPKRKPNHMANFKRIMFAYNLMK